MPYSDSDNVIRSTWVFKLKRLPDGTPSKLNTRFCVRGDLQKASIEYFESYAPNRAFYNGSRICFLSESIRDLIPL